MDPGGSRRIQHQTGERNIPVVGYASGDHHEFLEPCTLGGGFLDHSHRSRIDGLRGHRRHDDGSGALPVLGGDFSSCGFGGNWIDAADLKFYTQISKRYAAPVEFEICYRR